MRTATCLTLFKRLCKHYNLDYKLDFNKNITDLAYCEPQNKLIVLSKPNYGLLIHELAHAIEDKGFHDTTHRKRMLEVMLQIRELVKTKKWYEVK